MAQPNDRCLPGVKGAWILCSQCPPTEAEADGEGDVRAWTLGSMDWHFMPWSGVEPHQYWNFVESSSDPRPFNG